MLFDKFKSTLLDKLSKHTDSELLQLESRFREGNERDAADACSAILLQRRNRLLLAKDEYRRAPIGMTDEEYMNWL